MRNLLFSQFIFFTFTINQIILKVESVSFEQDVAITFQEKKLLDEFRNEISIYLPHEWMTKEIYLIRWLRAKNFNIPAAKKMLLQNLEWRKKNRMDTILEEDFSTISEEFPYYIERYSNNGQIGLLVYGNLGGWDFRAAAIGGPFDQGVRIMTSAFENVTTQLRSLHADGYNITQYDFLINMEGFNLMQHACLQCLSFITNFILTYENYFPGTCNQIYFVNCPSTVEVVLNAVKHLISPITRDSLQIHGTNKKSWQPKLFSHIPPEYLPLEVGGNRILDN